VQQTYFGEIIGIQRAAVSVYAVGRYPYSLIGGRIGDLHHDDCVVEVPVFIPKLDDISGLCGFYPGLGGKGARALILEQKVIEIFHPCPGGGPIVSGQIKPSEGWGIVHNARPRKEALGDKVGTVSSKLGKA
jgi:hypothetical protein